MSLNLVFRWLDLSWVTTLTTANSAVFYKTTALIHAVSSDKDRRSNVDVIRMLFLTWLTVLLFVIGSLSHLCARLVRMDILGWDHTMKRKYQDDQSFVWILMFTFISVASQTTGYATLFLVCFLRLKLTFDGSIYAISKQTTDRLYAWTAVSILLLFLAVSHIFFPWMLASIFVLVTLILVLSYVTLSIWICRKFYVSIRSISANGTSNPNNNNDNNSNTKSMLNLALKINILTVTAVCFTYVWVILGLLIITLVLVIPVFRETDIRALWSVVEWLYTLDGLVNSMCLLLTMKQSQHYYQWIFGRIHNYWIHRLLSFNHPSLPNETALSMSSIELGS